MNESKKLEGLFRKMTKKLEPKNIDELKLAHVIGYSTGLMKAWRKEFPHVPCKELDEACAILEIKMQEWTSLKELKV